MKCNNHPDKEAVAKYEKTLLCKNCLVNLLVEIDKKLNKSSGKGLNKIRPL